MSDSNRWKAWLMAFRIRTLPLALASIGMASFIAGSRGMFDSVVFTMACLTTIFLQVLSNLANDYGDSIHGADNEEREGPKRTIQAGLISVKAMKKAMYIVGGLALVSGVSLLYYSLDAWQDLVFFLLLGIVSIIAAITYTAGKKPYGYAGLGDLSVLLFFGLTGVIGCLYLYDQNLQIIDLLPALSCGLFAVGVLNVNNIRDIESDKKAGKYSIPVRLGRSKAIWYHWGVLAFGFLAAISYAWLSFHHFSQYLFLVCLPFLFINARAVVRFKRPSELDPYLKQLAFTTLLFVLTFGIGLIF